MSDWLIDKRLREIRCWVPGLGHLLVIKACSPAVPLQLLKPLFLLLWNRDLCARENSHKPCAYHARGIQGQPCPTSSWTGQGWPHRICCRGVDVGSSLQCWAARCHVKEAVEHPDSGVKITLPPGFLLPPCSVPTTNAESQQQGKCYVIKDPHSVWKRWL